jgi:hypothetical protein
MLTHVGPHGERFEYRLFPNGPPPDCGETLLVCLGLERALQSSVTIHDVPELALVMEGPGMP